jgi:hypothetical protein
MLAKSRKSRKFLLKVYQLKSLSADERLDLCQRLLSFSESNTQETTLEYLQKRAESYSHLCLALAEDKIVGFGFADKRSLKLSLFRNFPLIHFGLMIIDKEWRGERISRAISLHLIRSISKEVGPTIYLTGFAVSAKCSSPVSFYRLQQASLKIGFPKFNQKGALDNLSQSFVGKALSRSISRALNLGDIENFVIRDVNKESGFRLHQEEYKTNSSYEEKVLTFFQKNVIPNNEVLFISYTHPVIAL